MINKSVSHQEVETMIRKFMKVHGYTKVKGSKKNNARPDDIFKKGDAPSLTFEYKPFPADQIMIMAGIGQCLNYLASYPECPKCYLVIHEQDFFKLKSVFRYVPWLGLLIYRDTQITMQHKAELLRPVEISIRNLL